MKVQLAIVIPAYKATYLRATLESLANQTCKEFQLYIGNDDSPENLDKIINDYLDRIPIVYKHFDSNLGGKDLVAHWERCIEMITNEEDWIWLFSDDDIMEPTCVAAFYKHIAGKNVGSLLHFNVKQINGNGTVIKEYQEFPETISSVDFFKRRIQYNITSFVVEYIFKRKIYYKYGKFQNFDLAWCADDATWIKFASDSGIQTIQDAKVLWRYSSLNISGDLTNKSIVDRKVRSGILYIKWTKDFFGYKEDFDILTNLKKIRWVLMPVRSSRIFTLRESLVYAFSVCKELKALKFVPILLLYTIIYTFKRK